MKYKFSRILCISLITICCVGDKPTSDEIPSIRLDPNIATTYDYKDFFHPHTVVILESREDYILGEIKNIETDNGAFYINDGKKCIAFSRSGRILFKIDGVGKGPGEYLEITSIVSDTQEKTLTIFDNRSMKILNYDLTGKFINEEPTPVHGYDIEIFEGRYVIYSGSNIASKNRLNYLSKTTLNIENAFLPIKQNHAKFLHVLDLTNFYHFENKTYFLYGYGTTVYQLLNNAITERYTIDFGNHGIPESYLENEYANVKLFMEEINSHIYAHRILGFFESSKKIYSSFFYGDQHLHFMYDKDDGKSIVINEFIGDLQFLPAIEKTSFDNLPKAIDADTLIYVVSADLVLKNLENSFSSGSNSHSLRQIAPSDNPILYSRIFK